MKISSKFKVQSLKLNKSKVRDPRFPQVAFLWDESFLWGLMAYKALKANGLPFEIVRSTDIKNGFLKNCKMLFVPGGWASNKLKALGDKGVAEIKKFVNNGGNYLGFCGGAGLATLDGLGLLNIKRMPTKQRVPSFSGRIYLNVSEHPIWQSFKNLELIFNAWWPSQFLIADRNIKVLSTYGDALPDSFSSDLNVGDVESSGGWDRLENIYGINLDPKRLMNEPAVVKGGYGKGQVILSLIHFDAPHDKNGAIVLRNLWEYLGGERSAGRVIPACPESFLKKDSRQAGVTKKELRSLVEIETAVEELIALGIRNFLWHWRNPMLLQWRRGVRGLEYCTLYVMVKEIAEMLKKQNTGREIQSADKYLHKIRKLLMPFVKKAQRLLILERHTMQNSHITYAKCNDPEIQTLRTELFGGSKSHGGLFKDLINEVDDMLYLLIRKMQLIL